MGRAIVGCICFGVVVGLVLLISLFAVSMKKLQSDEVGLQYDKIQKTLGGEVFTEGLHLGPVGYSFIIFPNVYTTLEYDDVKCLNKDGVPIQIDVSFQFKVVLWYMKNIVMDFKDFSGYKDVLRLSGASVIRETCSLFNTSQFQAERGNFQTTLSNILKARYGKLHADVTDLQVNNIKRPSEYEAAIRSKERAREDIGVARNERPRLITEANTTRRAAQSDAQIIRNKAESDARVLENKAKTEASAILIQFEREAESYENIVSSSGLAFSPQGFISYLSTRVLASAKNPVFVSLPSPAQTRYDTRPPPS
ncbi:hypothetical protein ACOMHN_047019 [Nucella lapillus]